MPPTRNILSRRLSTYDPTIFNPPPTLRPSANRFYSWPRSLTRSQGTPSPPHGDSDASRIAKAAGKKVTIEDCYSEGSAGEEEVDQPDDDESDASDQREDTMEPSDQSSGNTSAPPTRATAQTTTTAPEPLRSSLKRRTTTQATGQAASPDPGLAAASTSRSGKPPSSQGATTRGGAPSASTDEDLGEATVNGPVVTRSVVVPPDTKSTVTHMCLDQTWLQRIRPRLYHQPEDSEGAVHLLQVYDLRKPQPTQYAASGDLGRSEPRRLACPSLHGRSSAVALQGYELGSCRGR